MRAESERRLQRSRLDVGPKLDGYRVLAFIDGERVGCPRRVQISLRRFPRLRMSLPGSRSTG